MNDPSAALRAGALTRLAAALSDRYALDREIGAGGMGLEPAADSRGSADVAEATTGLFKPAIASAGWWRC